MGKPKLTPLEIEYKEHAAARDRAKKAGSKALQDRSEKRMAEIQVQMFHEAARKAEASDDPKDFDKAFRRVTKRPS